MKVKQLKYETKRGVCNFDNPVLRSYQLILKESEGKVPKLHYIRLTYNIKQFLKRFELKIFYLIY